MGRHVRDAYCRVLLGPRLLAVKGRQQREGKVYNLIEQRLAGLSPILGRMATEGRDSR